LVVQLPKPVRGFVDGFDAGRYPRVLRLQVGDGPATGAGGGAVPSTGIAPPPSGVPPAVTAVP